MRRLLRCSTLSTGSCTRACTSRDCYILTADYKTFASKGIARLRIIFRKISDELCILYEQINT